ncbi:adiponectin receptor protein [Thraustotheca clavata]|uniref:Adiponectin receptor protein n=1 Tax=Thraustotheca clavata TaxID=74557 RepID=A0A1V9ZZ32_9STRA|nr:adiponectin receptor protein [Thraustotheca clavata]
MTTMREAASSVESMDERVDLKQEKKLASYHVLHDQGFSFLADNAYIRSGYRVNYSLTHCFQSLFELHNETWNVWTHIIGSLIFVCLLVSVFSMEYPLGASTAQVVTPNVYYLKGGHHTLAFFEKNIAPSILFTKEHTSYYTVDTQYQQTVVRRMHVASEILGHTIAQIPSLQRFHQLLESHAGDVSHLLTEQMESMYHELTVLQARLSPEVVSTEQFIGNSTAKDALFKWISSYNQIYRMKKQLRSRVDAFSNFLRQLETPKAYPSVQFVLKEFHSLTDSVYNGLQVISELHPSMFTSSVVGMWPIAVFITSAVVCLTMSSVYHLLFAMSPRASLVLSQLDYAGIILMIAGSFFPVIYYSFYCHQWALNAYLGIISVLAIGSFAASLIPAFGKYPSVRSAVFLSMGFFGVVPISHLIYEFGIMDAHVQIMLKPLLLMGALYVLGAVIYGTRFPERLYPGYFDVWFSSHQLWHICVVLAALVHYANAMQHYEWRWQQGCHA